MKHYLRILFIAVFLIIPITACGATDDSNPKTEQVESVEVDFELSKDEHAEMIKEKTVDIKEGAVVQDVLEENFDVETDDSGMIVSIDGLEAEQDENKAWIYTVNDEVVMVGAAEYELEAGDLVKFDFQSWD